MALIPSQHQTSKRRGGGGVLWPGFPDRGAKVDGRAGEGSSLGNCACPTSMPEELAEDKDLGAKCLPGIGGAGWGRWICN